MASAFTAACCALFAVGCGSGQAPVSRPPVLRGTATTEPRVSPAPFGAADLGFGLAVLNHWCSRSPRANIVLSPASLASGLGMAYLGAGGSTASAMSAVLHLPSPGHALLAGLQSRMAGLRALNRHGVTVSDADQLWTDPTLSTRRSFLDAIATGYGAGVGRVALLSQPAKAASQINAVISAATRGHIRHLVSARSLNGIGWLLTDAMYLQARWARPFVPGTTRAGLFTTATGQRVAARYLTGGYFRAGTADGWTAVALPYQGGRLQMLALLPAVPGLAVPPTGSAMSCAPMTPVIVEQLRSVLSAFPAGTAVALPKVNLSTSADLRGLLRSMGMGVAFSPAANFAGISPQAASIGLVQHAATLRVDERGTVASAATAVGILPTAGAPARTIVRFDRPYVMLVLDTVTGEPLFLARVANPDQP